jgi:Phage derived protein Gp49-like (DUF891)
MTELGRPKCQDCGRTTYQTGPCHIVEAARDRDGVEQADAFLEGLLRGKPKDRNLLSDLLVRFEDYCRTGKLETPRELRPLRDELWEIKGGKARMPFFKLKDSKAAAIRLTHGFIKNTNKTPRKEIDKGIAILREDQKR